MKLAEQLFNTYVGQRCLSLGIRGFSGCSARRRE